MSEAIKSEVTEIIKSNSILGLINTEFNLINKLEEEEIKLEEVKELLETIKGLDNNWYDYIDIFNEWEYRIIHEWIIEEIFEASVIDLVDDCMEIPANIRPYFDEEKFVADCKLDWYGQHFNWYDGNEIEWNGYYLFRNN